MSTNTMSLKNPKTNTSQPNLASTVRVNEKLYNFSPNEEARILAEETKNRRILRLLETRQANKKVSKKILAKNRYRKDKMINDLSAKLAEDWENEQNDKIKEIDYKLFKAEKDKGQAVEDCHIEEMRILKDDLTKQKQDAMAKIRENEATLREKEMKL